MKKAFTLAEGATHVDISADKYQDSFTLAEVLITLGIIGIVAAMTLPAVINNSRNKQLEAGLKRSYSLIGQALDMHQAQSGERATPENLKIYEMKPILMKYLQVIEDCGFGASDSNSACIPNTTGSGFLGDASKARKYKTYNGQRDININLFDDGQFVLNDGILVLIENSGTSVRLYISVDVNGYNKNPNRLGHDLFMFQINDKGTLLPMGAPNTNYYSKTDKYCSQSSTNSLNGAGCTYKALNDKDYFKNLPK